MPSFSFSKQIYYWSLHILHGPFTHDVCTDKLLPVYYTVAFVPYVPAICVGNFKFSILLFPPQVYTELTYSEYALFLSLILSKVLETLLCGAYGGG